MAGLYVHIPFCRSRCIYCGFYSTTALDLRQRYVDALCREWQLRRQEMTAPLDTIYLGGGTPSQLLPAQLQQLFDALPSAGAEVTMEVNPDDVTALFAGALSRLPITRISMGAQTFSDGRLKMLHRRHSAGQVTEAVSRLRNAGISNISIDLMYGFPDETLADWLSDIDSALSLNVEHLSAYCLMVEEGTPLYGMLHLEDMLSEDLERTMYECLLDRLESAGFEHYEISNFARPGFRSRHNSCYWDGTPYLGIGAAAHSYDGKTRSWNISDIRKYISGINSGERLFEEEIIDDDTRYNDLVTVALRTCEGLDLNSLSALHRDYCMKNARRFLDNGLLRLTTDNHLALTRQGLFVSDMIMSELMYVC